MFKSIKKSSKKCSHSKRTKKAKTKYLVGGMKVGHGNSLRKSGNQGQFGKNYLNHQKVQAAHGELLRLAHTKSKSSNKPTVNILDETYIKQIMNLQKKEGISPEMQRYFEKKNIHPIHTLSQQPLSNLSKSYQNAVSNSNYVRMAQILHEYTQGKHIANTLLKKLKKKQIINKNFASRFYPNASSGSMSQENSAVFKLTEALRQQEKQPVYAPANE